MALKSLLRSLVIRKKKDSLVRAVEGKDRGRGNLREREEEMGDNSDLGELDGHLKITEQCL